MSKVALILSFYQVKFCGCALSWWYVSLGNL